MPWIKKTFDLTRERRTYILGEFRGKYYGELDEDKKELTVEQYYDFTLYEGSIAVDTVEKLRKENAGPFPGFKEDDKFPGKLPDPLPCEMSFSSTKEVYKLDIHDLKFEKGSIQIVDHQQENEEVFGTLKAIATGYIRDDVHYSEERDVWEDEAELSPKKEDKQPETTLKKTLEKTGKEERSGGYVRYEYYYSQKPNTYWGSWTYQPQTQNQGCAPVLFRFLGVVLLVCFLFALGPGGLVLLVLGLVVYLFSFLGPKAGEWLMRGIGLFIFLLYLFGIIYGIVSNGKEGSRASQSYRISRDDERETSTRRTSRKSTVRTRSPIIDQTKSDDHRMKDDPLTTDSIISHHRIWRDYKGRQYEGDIRVLVSAYNEAQVQRMYFNPTASKSTRQYDQLLYSLTMHNRSSLGYVYQLFDSIGKANQLSRTDFAEMIVSCIQDIPYTLILNEGCDPRLYKDNFIQRYLQGGNQCDGNVQFGLYSPIEFMANLKGDCDTRTLLLFTILSYYNYEVAILSSEFYKHSILAVQLPYTGIHKDLAGKRFYTWETTFMDFKPGQLPLEVSDLNFWRTSLINQKTK